MALEEPGVKSQCREDLRSGDGFANVRSVEEPWDQIGRRLRESREEMSLSVDDVVHTTRIPRTIVEALEAEDFSVFTSPTYAKSFLRQYSDFLKVDAEPWLNALVPASYVSGTSWQPIFETPPEPPPPAKGQAKGQGKNSRHVEPVASTSGSNSFSAVATLVLTVALVWGGVQGYRKFDEKFADEVAAVINPSGKRPEKSQEANKESPAPAAGSSVAGTPGVPVPEKKASAPGTTAEPVSVEHQAEHRSEAEVPTIIPRAIIVRD